MHTPYKQRAELLVKLVSRDFSDKFKGSLLGIGWSVFLPLFMVGIYNFVFVYVFKARWVVPQGDEYPFALSLFLGITVHSVMAECINRAPSVILSNSVYVTKIPFPIEILPLVPIGASLLQGLVSMLIWITLFVIFGGTLSLSALYALLLLFPLVLYCMGFSFLFSSLGVFFRDIGQMTALLTTLLLFLGPIFFPLSSIPESYRDLFYLNPLTVILEEARTALMYAQQPNLSHIAITTCVATIFMLISFGWFQFTRKGFADVV